MVDFQETIAHYKVFPSDDLRSLVIKKSVLLGLLFGLLMPIVLLEFLNLPHSLGYLQKYAMIILGLVPSIAFIAFIGFRQVYKCPKCRMLWAYQRIGETILETFVMRTELDENQQLNELSIERYIIESACNKCHYKTLVPKKRKLIKKVV